MKWLNLGLRALGVVVLSMSAMQVFAVAPAATLTNTVNVNYSDTAGVTDFTASASVTVTVNLIYDVAWDSVLTDVTNLQSGTETSTYAIKLTNLGNGTLDRVFITNDNTATTANVTLVSFDYTDTPTPFSAISTTSGTDGNFSLFSAVVTGAPAGGDCDAAPCTIPISGEGWVAADIAAGRTVTINGADAYECTVDSFVDNVSITISSCGAAPTIAIGDTVNEFLLFDFDATLGLNGSVGSDTYAHPFTADVYTNGCTLGSCGAVQDTEAQTHATTTVLGPVGLMFKYVATSGSGSPACGDAGVDCVVYNGTTYYDQDVTAQQADDLTYLLLFVNSADAGYDTAAELETSCTGGNDLSTCDGAASSTMGTAAEVVLDDAIPVYTTMTAPGNVFVDIGCDGTVVDGSETYGNEASGVVRISTGGTGVGGDTLYFYLGAGADDDDDTGARANGGTVGVDSFICSGFTTRVD